ncbi:unnamed protein product [Vitrella brassicaformis CCMP3155]|uniref:Uncharacterized protein n=3 Tax=Vitrella brassicaformis TaxID=1169539 RepID=A0A0G4EZ09_VITBC|nr:unnamed protein product [Vitrella brassicaformis CCMP3155]|eukprot:CEM04428.1 unnamed protein product [Vitrella brassicaformis CCMP3155]
MEGDSTSPEPPQGNPDADETPDNGENGAEERERDDGGEREAPAPPAVRRRAARHTVGAAASVRGVALSPRPDGLLKGQPGPYKALNPDLLEAESFPLDDLKKICSFLKMDTDGTEVSLLKRIKAQHSSDKVPRTTVDPRLWDQLMKDDSHPNSAPSQQQQQQQPNRIGAGAGAGGRGSFGGRLVFGGQGRGRRSVAGSGRAGRRAAAVNRDNDDDVVMDDPLPLPQNLHLLPLEGLDLSHEITTPCEVRVGSTSDVEMEGSQDGPDAAIAAKQSILRRRKGDSPLIQRDKPLPGPGNVRGGPSKGRPEAILDIIGISGTYDHPYIPKRERDQYGLPGRPKEMLVYQTITEMSCLRKDHGEMSVEELRYEDYLLTGEMDVKALEPVPPIAVPALDFNRHDQDDHNIDAPSPSPPSPPPAAVAGGGVGDVGTPPPVAAGCVAVGVGVGSSSGTSDDADEFHSCQEESGEGEGDGGTPVPAIPKDKDGSTTDRGGAAAAAGTKCVRFGDVVVIERGRGPASQDSSSPSSGSGDGTSGNHRHHPLSPPPAAVPATPPLPGPQTSPSQDGQGPLRTPPPDTTTQNGTQDDGDGEGDGDVFPDGAPSEDDKRRTQGGTPNPVVKKRTRIVAEQQQQEQEQEEHQQEGEGEGDGVGDNGDSGGVGVGVRVSVPGLKRAMVFKLSKEGMLHELEEGESREAIAATVRGPIPTLYEASGFERRRQAMAVWSSHMGDLPQSPPQRSRSPHNRRATLMGTPTPQPLSPRRGVKRSHPSPSPDEDDQAGEEAMADEVGGGGGGCGEDEVESPPRKRAKKDRSVRFSPINEVQIMDKEGMFRQWSPNG